MHAVGKIIGPLLLSLAATSAGCAARHKAKAPSPPEQSRGPLAVTIENESEPVLCAEKDNVTIAASGQGVKSFRLEVSHPVYVGSLRRDSTAADWTACDMSGDPAHAAAEPPRIATIYEDAELRLVGHTLPTFWREATAKVRIGERVESGLHLVQLFLKRGETHEEVLVLYPQDGYFRARPLAPEGLADTAYGSSFLIGPIERAERPVVRLTEVRFEPATRSFTLAFARGGSARLGMVQTDAAQSALDVRFDPPIGDRPFAMLRSMYVTEFNNDVARIALREHGAPGFREDNIMKFDAALATDVWMGRLTPSQHNTSSPDTVFRGFSRTDQPAVPAPKAP